MLGQTSHFAATVDFRDTFLKDEARELGSMLRKRTNRPFSQVGRRPLRLRGKNLNRTSCGTRYHHTVLKSASANVRYLCRSQLLVEFFGRRLVFIPGFLCPLLGVFNGGLGGHPNGQLGSAEKRLTSNEIFLDLVELCTPCLPGRVELESYRTFEERAWTMSCLLARKQ